VAVLALTLIVLSVRGDSSSNPTTTTLVAGTSTTTTTSTPSTTTTGATTLTTTAEQRLAEVEVLLQDLWFGWFDAIYRKDPDALWQVVATTQSHDAGVAAMETMEFTGEPNADGVNIESLEMLLDRADCLVAFYTIDVSDFRGTGSTSEHVSVLWPDERYGFRLATGWTHPDDLWLMDCDNLEREVTP
jgi:hypothetical protein